MRAVQLSKPGMIAAPRAANSAAPCAVCSVKLAKPMPMRRPSGSPRSLACADRAQVQQFGAEPHARRVIAVVVAHAGDRGVRHLVGPDHVLDAHFDRIAAHRMGNLVDRPLDREAGAGAADAAIRTERRLVGGDSIGAGAVVRDRVGARQAARRHVGFLIRALRPQAVGAGIDGDLAIDAEDVAVPVGIGGDAVMMIAGMGGGQQMFVAVLDPAHRVVELQRQRREDDLFRIQPRLGTEAAADVGCDHPDAALLETQDIAERDTHRVRRLGRGVDHDLVEPVVATGEHAAALHRCAGLPVHAVFAADRDRGGTCRGVDVTARDGPLLEQVVAEVVMHQGRLPPRAAGASTTASSGR